jgi:aquaporin TIP
MARPAFGHAEEISSPDALRGTLAEFIALFFFVFVGVGSSMSYQKIHGSGDLGAGGLLIIAIAHGIALAVLVAATSHISGGHVNPAVSLALALAGQITIVRLIMYWIAQLLGAVAGAWVLQKLTTGEPVSVHTVGVGETVFGAMSMEAILTFALVFVVFATGVDPKRGNIGVIAPLAIGFTVLVNILVGAPYTGGSMNPARSFGPAIVEWDFTNHWVYWVGPFLGAAVAAAIYDGIFLNPATVHTHSAIPEVF